MTLQDFIKSARNLFCPEQKGLLAVSGGIDSTALCHLMHQARFAFSIAHCNFHLRPGDCDRDEYFVRELAKRYGVNLYVAQFDTYAYATQYGQSIEEAARNLRYQFFNDILDGKVEPQWKAPDSDVKESLAYIATAHHRDDSTETFFINLLRGTGLAGLHGIPSVNGNIVRPLLPFGRDEIEQYAQMNGLSHVEDFTNATTAYKRNQIRLQLMPLLREIEPNIDRTMQQNIARLADAEKIYQSYISLVRGQVLVQKEDGCSIAISEIEKLSPPRTLLFELIREFGFSISQVDEILKGLHSQSGLQFYSRTHRIVKDRSQLLIFCISPSLETGDLIIEKDTSSVLLTNGKVMRVRLFANQPSFVPSKSKDTACLDSELIQWPLSIRHWKEGDRFKPFGMKGTRLVSDYFSDQKFSLIEKEQALLLVDAKDTILWIIGHRVAHYPVKPSTKNILILSIE
ncbi:MAG: tRNA lysidine(34) synthetase TilS [Bacteroidales bacterium]|nr:tRNA lysidine(34) synthetase TilS [Bacteroidales bacterium]